MGPGFTVGDGGNFSKDGPGEESREVQDHGVHARVHMGEVDRICVQYTGNSRRSNISGAEDIVGKLSRMRRDSGTIISKVEHGEPT